MQTVYYNYPACYSSKDCYQNNGKVQDVNISLDEYQQSLVVNAQGYPFYALIVAAMRQADTDNLEKLKQSFPDVWRSFKIRYDNSFGIVPEWDGFTAQEYYEERKRL